MESEVDRATSELGDGWVEFETEGADFSDKRLNKRYTRVLGQMSRMPQSPFTQSSEDLSEMLGAYRFIENSKVTVEKILEPHREQVRRRAYGESVVLLIQDTTFFDFSDHYKCEDLKPLRIKQAQRALWLHGTACILPNGRPLGIVDAQFMSGGRENSDRTKTGSHRKIKDKQSMRWLDAVSRCRDLFDKDVRKVWICDREADIYEFLDHLHGVGEEFVIRSKYLREIEEGPYFDMRDALERAPVQGEFSLSLPGTGLRSKRTANLAIKVVRATISVPGHKRSTVSFQSVPTYVVEVAEVNPPANQEGLHWRLLTNVSIESFADALQVIQWYQKRWAIEEIYRVLKSGCRAEKAQFHNTARIAKYLTLSILVAWRIYFLVHINRLDPDAPAETVLTTPELETLQLLSDDKRRMKGNQRRAIIKTVAQAITQIATLGGFLEKKKYPYPGTVVLWRGTMALAFSTMTFLAHRRAANS